MDETSLVQMQKGSFLQKLILALTESKRREIAMAELILEFFHPIFNKPSRPKKTTDGGKNMKNVIKNERKERLEKIKDKGEPLTEMDLNKKKWEMRTKCKL